MSELRAIARGVPGAEWRRIIDVPAPGAGHDVTVRVPGKKVWRLLSVSCLFTASGVAGNRNLVLALNESSGIAVVTVPILTTITAGLARVLSWSAGLGVSVAGSGTAVALPLPNPWYMAATESITISGHTDAGDVFTSVRAVVIETNDGDIIHERNIEQSIVDHARALYDLTH